LATKHNLTQNFQRWSQGALILGMPFSEGIPLHKAHGRFIYLSIFFCVTQKTPIKYYREKKGKKKLGISKVFFFLFERPHNLQRIDST
jgi:hypothetical protein